MDGTLTDARTAQSLVVQHVPANELEVHDLLHQGLPIARLRDVMASLRVLKIPEVVEKALGISPRTWIRWKRRPADDRIDPTTSSRLWTFVQILDLSRRVFGRQEDAEDWLQRPAMALDWRRPIDLLDTSAGIEAVQTLLGRLLYDVFT